MTDFRAGVAYGANQSGLWFMVFPLLGSRTGVFWCLSDARGQFAVNVSSARDIFRLFFSKFSS